MPPFEPQPAPPALRPREVPAVSTEPRLLRSGAEAFAAIFAEIARAERSIDVRAFVWRDDDTGNLLAQALLDAAERGVQVHIAKDRVGANYEYFDGNCQSFFHKRIEPVQRLQTYFLYTVYPRWQSFRQRQNALAEALVRHPNVSVFHEERRFDHAKVFVFDGRTIVLGSMGIGNNHHHEWLDQSVVLQSPALVERMYARMHGHAELDPTRNIDFLVHHRKHHGLARCPMLHERLGLIDAAQQSLTIEMAYLGDKRFSAALLRAIQRGVDVTMLVSRRGDIISDLNLETCNMLLRQTGAPSNLRIFLHNKVVHSKVVVIDHARVDIGSANFTPLSHGVYDEVNTLIVQPSFARAVETLCRARCNEAEQLRKRVRYSRIYSNVERAIVAYQSRNAPKA